MTREAQTGAQSSPAKKRDPLAAAKTDAAGEPVANVREHVVDAVSTARKEWPQGVPSSSPFATMIRERLFDHANGLDLGSVTGLLTEEELRLCMHAEMSRRTVNALPPHVHEGETMRGVSSQPPAPIVLEANPPPPAKVAKPGDPTVWRCTAGKRCALGGQIFWVGEGSIIRAGDYLPGQIKILVDQGLKLEPWTE